MKETQKAYIAGILDGEGCFYIKKRTDNKFIGYQIMISISQKNYPDLMKLKELIGIKKVYVRKPSKTNCGSLAYASKQAYDLCSLVLPYLNWKEEEAILLQYFYDKLKSHRWKKSPELDSLREGIFQRVKEIKREK